MSSLEKSRLLFEAAKRGEVELCRRLLLSEGGDLNMLDPDESGRSTLHVAIDSGNVACALFFAQISDDELVDLQEPETGCTPLMIACRRNLTPVAYALVRDRGARVLCANSLMETPLHYAVWCENFWICKLLLETGHPAHVFTVTGSTPLLYATRTGCREICELLLWYEGLIPAPLTSSLLVAYMYFVPRPDWELTTLLDFIGLGSIKKYFEAKTPAVEEFLYFRDWKPEIREIMSSIDDAEDEEVGLKLATEIIRGYEWLLKIEKAGDG